MSFILDRNKSLFKNKIAIGYDDLDYQIVRDIKHASTQSKTIQSEFQKFKNLLTQDKDADFKKFSSMFSTEKVTNEQKISQFSNTLSMIHAELSESILNASKDHEGIMREIAEINHKINRFNDYDDLQEVVEELKEFMEASQHKHALHNQDGHKKYRIRTTIHSPADSKTKDHSNLNSDRSKHSNNQSISKNIFSKLRRTIDHQPITTMNKSINDMKFVGSGGFRMSTKITSGNSISSPNSRNMAQTQPKWGKR